ncbi:DUF881 domain-containing protein [Niallia sp. XMNu-256]|uniref:DUF881 domain-containing protein n=1 Tax=Niallia sp. XMNu-256 TaxID=3082444 RepID=UPI0030CE76CD
MKKEDKPLKKMTFKKKFQTKYLILTIVALVFGFMISYSYHLTSQQQGSSTITSSQYERDMELRNELIQQEEKNLILQKELNEKQKHLLQIEQNLSDETTEFYNLTEDTEKFRMYLGKVKVKGSGIQVTLDDAEYNPQHQNPNQYIVHEHHVFKVINELKISGASSIAVNGQKISHDSYILCNGPVIEIDGKQHPAPFVITAIGDGDIMAASLNIKGGVKDVLVNENVQFTIEKKEDIVINTKLEG